MPVEAVLRQCPEVQVGGGRILVHALEASPEERCRLWPNAERYNPSGPVPARTSREIPLVLLEPREATR